MLLYILIFGLAVLGSVLLLWYFDPLEREDFQTQAASASATKTTPPTFWDLVYKIDKQQDPATIASLAKVTDPDPNDTNDLMPLQFSKYISIYALSQPNGPSWQVTTNQGNIGNDIASFVGTVEQGKARCLATPGCTEFASYKGTNFIKSIPTNAGKMSAISECTTYKLLSDVSGARQSLFTNYNALQGGLSRNVYARPPEGTDVKARSCANLDAARNSYTTKYNRVMASAQDLSGTAITASLMREENLAYQNANLAACKGGDRSPACISLANQEGPVFSLLSKYSNVNNTFAISGAVDISNNLDVINTAYSVLGCSGPPLSFSQDLANIIDTQTLLSQLNKMSPYYLSPDTLQYITSSIISGPDTDSKLTTDADMLKNISTVISNIKAMTGAS